MSETKRRGRPIGSKNKPKIELKKTNGGSYVLNVKMEKQIEDAPVNRDSHRGWINFGTDNRYPNKLADLYHNSPTHHSACDFLATAILGEGVDYVESGMGEDTMPNYQYDFDTLIYNLALDYAIYGGYAMQIIKNNDDKTYSFYHQPYETVRCSPFDEDGVITSYWVSDDWTAVSKFPPIELPSFGFQDDEEIKKGQAYLFVYNDYTPLVPYYSLPKYNSAIKAIQTEIELLRFDLKSVLNNFSASGILTLNRIDDDAERQAIIDNIQALFVGSDNANSLIINFKQNDEENPATFVKIDKDAGNNVNLFAQLDERVEKKILRAHRVPKILLGGEIDGASLGGDGNELAVQYNLYNLNVAQKARKAVVRTINNALHLNGIDTQIVLKPLKFNIMETASATTTTTNVQEGNAEEQSEKATSENNNNTIIER